MKNYTLVLLLLCSLYSTTVLAQQWTQTMMLPFADRYDDVYFVNEDLGWTVSGTGKIFKTEDGGDTWEELYSNPHYYFRALEFINEEVGFVGSLDSAFLKTTDGGATWTDIRSAIPAPIKGICGLSHAGDHVFGVGVWSYPAYFIKSEDQGETWTYQDLSTLADGLVECHFVTQELGFIAGVDEDAGAIILKTSDGGDTWEKVLDTQGGAEYIWKLDFVNDEIAYGVIESFTNSTRIVKSTDGGDNWMILEVAPETIDVQGIGFIDASRGWVGPRNAPMYETKDGGLTWTTDFIGYPNINRFFRVTPNLMYASGYQVYKFNEPITVKVNAPQAPTEHAIVAVTPNPFRDELTAFLRIDNRTFARLDLLNTKGQRVQNLHVGYLSAGEHQFQLTAPAQPLAKGIYLLVLRTNEGFITKQLIKH